MITTSFITVFEDLEHPAYVLVGHRGEDADQRAEAEGLGDRRRSSPGTVRVVRRIEHHRGVSAYDLHPAGEADLAKPSRTTSGFSALSPRNASTAASACAALAA